MFNEYPYTDYSNLNLDPMLKKIGETEKGVAENKSDIAAQRARIDSMTGLYNYVVNAGLAQGNVLAIGDSYAQGYTAEGMVKPWPEILAPLMKLSFGNTFKSRAQGGAGFVNNSQGKNFLNLLNDSINDFADRTIVSDVIVAGGANDGSFSDYSILAAILTFCSRCRELYPNAKIHIGVLGYSTNLDIYRRENIMTSYSNCYKYGAVYLGNFAPLLLIDRTNLMSSDNLHPNTAGQQVLANAIYNSLHGYYVRAEKQNYVTSNVSVLETCQNGIVTVEGFGLLTLDLSPVATGFACTGLTSIATVPLTGFIDIPTEGAFMTSSTGYVLIGSTYHNCFFKIELSHNQLKIYPYSVISNGYLTGDIKRLQIAPFGFRVDMGLC